MAADKLKPHIHLVKGKNHYAFFDILSGYLYRLALRERRENFGKNCCKQG